MRYFLKILSCQFDVKKVIKIQSFWRMRLTLKKFNQFNEKLDNKDNDISELQNDSFSSFDSNIHQPSIVINIPEFKIKKKDNPQPKS